MRQRRIVVTGVGLLGACGIGTPQVWDAVRRGQDSLRPLSLFASTRYRGIPVGEIPGNVDQLAGRFRGSRSDKLAWIAAREALNNADLNRPTRLGITIGATVGGMLGTERFLQTRLHNERANYGVLRFHECASAADMIARELGATGPVLTFSTACSGGALAIAAAGEMILNNEADVVLAGGCDSLCRLTLHGFGSLLLLDPNGCRPFDAQRAGISLGEGAAVLVLESADHALARGANILAELTGWAATCDAHHATAPEPNGAGALSAMKAALARASLPAESVDFVCAHGTATRDNDGMETRALRQCFGTKLPPVSSNKRCFGHTLGASGAINAAVSVLAIRDQVLPASPGFAAPDPEVGLTPVAASQPAALRHVMSNAFGFGGNNVVLVFSGCGREPARGPAHPAPVPEAASMFAATTRGKGDLPRRPVAIVGVGTSEGDFAAEVPPARRRRLARLQQMTLAAAKRAWPAGIDPTRTCVSIGTALGSLNEATAFVENLLLKNEAEPLPQRFTNSVHNALAGQVAIEFGLKGMNSTPTCRELSFEVALWQAWRELQAGNADRALAGWADEINPYDVEFAKRWKQPPPVEGAVVFALVTKSDRKPLARLERVLLGRFEIEKELAADVELVVTNVAGVPGNVLVNTGTAADRFRLALASGQRCVATYTVAGYGQKALCVLRS